MKYKHSFVVYEIQALVCGVWNTSTRLWCMKYKYSFVVYEIQAHYILIIAYSIHTNVFVGFLRSAIVYFEK